MVRCGALLQPLRGGLVGGVESAPMLSQAPASQYYLAIVRCCEELQPLRGGVVGGVESAPMLSQAPASLYYH